MNETRGDDEDNFLVPEQPKSKGGRRVGAGRKRVHEGGYKSVKDLLWKNLTVHTEVFEEWSRIREICGFRNNSDFAVHLLNNMKTHNTSGDNTQTDQSLRYVQD